MPSKKSKFLSLKEACLYLKTKKIFLSENQLRKLILSKKLPAQKIKGKWQIKKSSLKKFFQIKSKTKSKKSKKEFKKEILFPLPFFSNYALKLSLIKLSKKSLKFSSKIFKKCWQEALALILLSFLLLSSFFWYLPPSTKAATYQFIQTDWSGGATSTVAIHPDNQTGWNYYQSASNYLSTSTSGELSLKPTIESFTQTSDSDFNQGSFSSTTITGSGNEASVILLSTFRRPISIFNSTSTDLTDYQISFTLDTQSL
ncbi:helix-turn-helix domain-containing protein, partial [bacterium]|nr:helix-turn-helix domain-containing protein [bacterium]